MTTDLCR